jgi:hypothetical protein
VRIQAAAAAKALLSKVCRALSDESSCGLSLRADRLAEKPAHRAGDRGDSGGSMTDYIIRPTAWLVAPASDPRLFSERGYRIEIDDEGGGEFVNVRDMTLDGARQVAIEGEAWSAVRLAIDSAFAEIKAHEDKTDD